MERNILIVGAGPVGLSLALALCRQGIAVTVFEKELQLSDEMRASTFHAASMEYMEKWGVLDDVLKQGHKVDHLQFWDRGQKKIVGDFDYQVIADDTKYPFRLQCPQNIYAQTLLNQLRKEPLATIQMGHAFLNCEQNSESVTAKFQTDDGEQSYKGFLLCGADGANSAVRRHLDFSFDGMTYEDRFLLVGTNLDLDKYYPGIASVNYIYDPEEWVIVLKLNQMLRVVFQVHDDQVAEEELDESRIRARMKGFIGEEVDFPILHKSIYRVHQRVADSFRRNRCLLLGDAAHINNPASGMGMNSGILDAACLSLKIIEYMRSGKDIHLDEYSDERRNYALDKIKNYTKERYQDLSAKSNRYREKRNSRMLAMSKSPELSREYLLKASMLDERI